MELLLLLLRMMLLQLRGSTKRWCFRVARRWGGLASMGMGIYELGEVFRLRCHSHWCLRWCRQCGASLMLLYASVVERGYHAHCGANMALACCHPRLILSAAARWLRGSRDLQREIESERCMMNEHSHKHQWLPGPRPWPWLQRGGSAPERLVARQSSGLAASAASRAQVFCARMCVML